MDKLTKKTSQHFVSNIKKRYKNVEELIYKFSELAEQDILDLMNHLHLKRVSPGLFICIDWPEKMLLAHSEEFRMYQSVQSRWESTQ